MVRDRHNGTGPDTVDRKNSQKRTTTHTLPRGGNGRGITEELRWLDVSRSLVGLCTDDLCVMENEDPAILGSQTSRLSMTDNIR